jgi:1-acyl-sn-glycerol-3-phosphate acyltransferase
MIVANKNPLLDGLLYLYLRARMRRTFYSVEVRGLEHLQQLPPDRSVIAVSNHTNWWDGLVVFLLTRAQPAKSFYCMMDERQLRHYRFFTWLGAFSVDQENPIRTAATMRYVVRLLRNPSNLVWIFPQGEMVSARQKITVKPGTTFLASRSGATLILPVAFRYEFFREDRPQILVDINPAFSSLDCDDECLRTQLQLLADRLEVSAASGDLSGFTRIFHPRPSINKRWERIVRLFRKDPSPFQDRN